MTFPANSRYAGVEVLRRRLADGREYAYLARRFAPDPDTLGSLQEHVVAEGDRLDNIAALHLGDPEAYWRIADANRAMRPDLLEEVGRRLRITLPESVPGPSNV